jgi:hypothetical protein
MRNGDRILKTSKSRKTKTDFGEKLSRLSQANRLYGILMRSNFYGFLRTGFFQQARAVALTEKSGPTIVKIREKTSAFAINSANLLACV